VTPPALRHLPVDDILPELVRASRRTGRVVLIAPTGAGKTTRVPGALLDAGLAGDRIIVMLEPRRVAARAAARRIAEERGVRLGGAVGYRVRHDSRASAETRLLVVTEGVLLRMLQQDPFLESVGAVVFDEFHERSIQSDLALALVREVQREAREDLALVVMSATLDPGPVATWLDAPIVRSEGRTHPVDIRWLDRPDDRHPADRVAAGIRRALAETTGHVLAFQPGVGEVMATLQGLRDIGVEALPLHGRLSADEQDRAIRPNDRRRVVVATNIAETSLTIPGVTSVVDSGLARILRYDVGCGLNRLELARISRAAADQRAGRAGRERPGVCYRLWTRSEERVLPDRDEPEIRRIELSAVVLQLAEWGVTDATAFGWFEAPDARVLERATALLTDLGALHDGAITDLGRAMARLPLDPRLGRMAIESARRGAPDAGALAAALLSDRDIVRASALRDGGGTAWTSRSDVLDRVRALRGERGRFRQDALTGGRHHVQRSAKQLERALGSIARETVDDADDALLRGILAGWPDRVCQRRAPGSSRAVSATGRGVELDPSSAVRDDRFFVAVDEVAGRRGERATGRVRLASAVDPAWLDTTTEIEVRYDTEADRVSAYEVHRYRSMVLHERVVRATDAAAVERCLATVVAADPGHALGLDRPEVAAYVARVRNLNRWMPNLELPAFDDGSLGALAPQLVFGCRSIAEVRRRAPDALRSILSWPQQQALDTHAPERLEVPSGSRIQLQWHDERPPVLAVRMQELFGATSTPRIAGGRVPVLLHLLAPNMRPQQVTDDLAGFWVNTWPEVRKELRARYPKHAWPEDPTTATPMRGARRRRPQ
jgi:ATP-dependent helicase HrpB